MQDVAEQRKCRALIHAADNMFTTPASPANVQQKEAKPHFQTQNLRHFKAPE